MRITPRDSQKITEFNPDFSPSIAQPTFRQRREWEDRQALTGRIASNPQSILNRMIRRQGGKILPKPAIFEVGLPPAAVILPPARFDEATRNQTPAEQTAPEPVTEPAPALATPAA